ncbi:MAG TPA: MoaD/ThiS family protein [Thermoplasmata archaeon]|nr:MoaD/ThiS family protein [Thermoplasmata archaeon]
MAEVHLDAMLREFSSRRDFVSEAPTVGDLLDELERDAPRLRYKLRDETGALRRYVKIFVDGEDVSRAPDLRVSLSGVRTVDILHSIAGG